ncbi:hypothetical protein Trydic_g17494 [Trypoxylus dichotomus]
MNFVHSNNGIYEVGVFLMQFLGEDVHSTSKKLVLYRIMNCIVMTFVLIFTTANFLRVQGEMYIDTLESWISLNHIFLKYVLFVYYKSDIGSIMEMRLKKYWSYTHFNRNITGTVEKTFNLVKSVENFLLVLTVFLMYMIFLQPILFKDAVFLVKTWVFVDSRPLEAVVLACQYYIYIVVIPIVVGYDIWYLTLCVDLIVQVRLIKYSLRYIEDDSPETGVKQIGAIVRHHLVLLSDTSFVNCLLKIPTLLFIFGEFAYYAVLAEQVSFEVSAILFAISIQNQFSATLEKFSDLSSAIYMSRWYGKNIEIQKLLLFIMVKSQRVKYFTGAGLMDINIDAFGSVSKLLHTQAAIV